MTVIIKIIIIMNNIKTIFIKIIIVMMIKKQ